MFWHAVRAGHGERRNRTAGTRIQFWVQLNFEAPAAEWTWWGLQLLWILSSIDSVIPILAVCSIAIGCAESILSNGRILANRRSEGLQNVSGAGCLKRVNLLRQDPSDGVNLLWRLGGGFKCC
jgi:hypothetical protein